MYRTKDLSEASMLLVKGVKLVDIKRIEHICWFLFDDIQKSETLSHEFQFGECFVDARSYYQAMITLKHKIFSK